MWLLTALCKKHRQMGSSAEQSICIDPKDCWTPASSDRRISAGNKHLAQETQVTPNNACLCRHPVINQAKSSFTGSPVSARVGFEGHKLDHTGASLGHLLPIMGTGRPCGCLLYKCFQPRKEKVGQRLPPVLSAPGCQE